VPEKAGTSQAAALAGRRSSGIHWPYQLFLDAYQGSLA